MRVLYLMTAPPPVIPGTDAVLQEAEHLRSLFDGEILHLGPSLTLQRYVPRLLYGWSCVSRLRELGPRVDVYHIYHAELFVFPLIRWLTKPVVYTVVSGLQRQSRLPPAKRLRRLGAIVVSLQADLERLEQHGLENVHLMTAGIDLSRFDYNPPPGGNHFVLMVGSAPWTKKQFHTKGIDSLLQVAQKKAELRLVFLWRGVLTDEVRRRVQSRGLEQRVEVVNQPTDVSRLLGRVHAVAVLADKPKLVKAYPHSLLEAVACGRPVLVSDGVGMADYVKDTGCGQVVRGVDPHDLAKKIELLKDGYRIAEENARRVGKRDFPIENLVVSYRSIYGSLQGRSA